MKTIYKSIITIFLTFAVLLSSSCNTNFTSQSANAAALPAKAAVSAPKKITPHTYNAFSGVKPLPRKAQTIMIYMNGSDLESKYEAATDDLIEMADSGFDDKNINLVIFTGGAKKWHLNFIPNKKNAVFKMTSNGDMTQLAEAGTDSLGSPEVLAGFINFTKKYFPANNYGLIFWNHGGGAVVGYGSDERYKDDPNKAMMKLAEIDSALAASAPKNNFGYIGFDTCLMATLEMAGIAAKYADYMIASEELEPGDGWDYDFLGDILPHDTGEEIGELIVDYYADFYENSEMDDVATLSLTDLSMIEPAYHNFEAFASAADKALIKGHYNTISKARSSSRAFGGGDQNEETDMVDVMQIADSLSSMFPNQSEKLINSLHDAVIYQYSSYDEELGGLSVYFPFANKKFLDYNVKIYRTMGQLPNYCGFITRFSSFLNTKSKERAAKSPAKGIKRGNSIVVTLPENQLKNLFDVRLTTWTKPEQLGFEDIPGYLIKLSDNKNIAYKKDGALDLSINKSPAAVNGITACVYEISRNIDRVRYAIPAVLNAEDVYLIAVQDAVHPQGRVIGAVPSGDDVFNTLNKKMIELCDGDKITIRYYAKLLGTKDTPAKEKWFLGDEFTLNGPLTMGQEIPGKIKSITKINVMDQKQDSNYVEVEAA